VRQQERVTDIRAHFRELLIPTPLDHRLPVARSTYGRVGEGSLFRWER
jgi:hypothetical protein